MIIEVKKVKEVELCTLDYGEVFEYGEDIYMVIPSFITDGEEAYNVIDLSCGYAEYLPAGTKVVPHPKAKLIIED